MSSTPLAFLDTETFGLRDDDAVFEAAVAYETGDPLLFSFPVSADMLRTATPEALEVNGFERRWQAHQGQMFADVQCRRALSGHMIVGSNPDFDASRLLRRWGLDADSRGVPWHHRKLNLSDAAYWVLGLDEPPGMAKVVALLNDQYGAGIEPEGVHTAVAGVVTLRNCWQALRRIADDDGTLALLNTAGAVPVRAG